MIAERWRQIRDVLEKAVELPPGERSAYLNQACASDRPLRQEVEALLAGSEEVRSSFLQSSLLRMSLTPGTKLGDYEVKSLLGAGGMGEVYRARDSRLGRDVAIKVLPSFLTADSERRRRFEQEARAAAALNHPNILAVFQMGTYEGAPYLVSELLEGETLREEIQRGRLPLRKAVDYAMQIARGLAVAHEKGIVHRDLKPENLFVTKDGRVKILDFGLAKLTQPQSTSEHDAPTLTVGTEAGVIMGTVGYMSPEQVRGQTVDHRADIFAFGTILYEMLAGKRAFQKSTAADTMSAILNEEPASVSQVTANIPPALQRVVHRCLEKNPEQRFQSASDLAFALDALSESSAYGSAGNLPVEEHGHSLSSRTKLIAGGGLTLACITVLLVLGLGKERAVRAPMVQRQLTARTASNSLTLDSMSRDGKYLALEDKEGISIQEIENDEVHKLPGTAGLDPLDWYPDGLRLLVGDGKDLFTLFAFSGGKQKLVSNALGGAISRDGSQILLFRQGGSAKEPREVWIMPSSGGEPKLRFSLGANESFIDGNWSPNGDAIADIRLSEKGLSRAAVLETRGLNDGKTRTLLTDLELVGGGPNNVLWLPDGRILFALYKGGASESDLWSIQVNSAGDPVGKPVRITNTSGSFVAYMSASRDGNRLAVTRNHYPFSIFTAKLSEAGGSLQQPQRLTEDSWNNWPKAWTPDSQALLYVSARANLYSIYKMRIQSPSADLLTSGLERETGAGMSADGAWLLVAVNGKDSATPRLLRVPVSGGAPEAVLTPTGFAWVGCGTLGSRDCVLAELHGKEVVFSRVDPLRGRLGEIATITVGDTIPNAALSPDAKRVAMIENLGDSLQVLDLSTKKIQVIHPVPPQEGMQVPAWSADGKQLFVSAFPNSTGRLLQIDATTGRSRVLLENPNGWIGEPLPSPDGKRIAYVYVVPESNVTLLENF
jgi:serine/threonine protein kinase/Tol biopolymer transport system component